MYAFRINTFAKSANIGDDFWISEESLCFNGIREIDLISSPLGRSVVNLEVTQDIPRPQPFSIKKFYQTISGHF